MIIIWIIQSETYDHEAFAMRVRYGKLEMQDHLKEEHTQKRVQRASYLVRGRLRYCAREELMKPSTT